VHWEKSGPIHTARLENLLLNEILIPHSGQFFDHHAQENVSTIGIRETLSGVELHWFIGKFSQVISGALQGIPRSFEEEAVKISYCLFIKIIRNARRVREKMPD